MQDSRSRVYNFTPYIQLIPNIQDFDFERLEPFTPSSRDTVLRDLALREKRTFAGSTSSLSGLLSHIYFLISRHKPVNLGTMADPFKHMVRCDVHFYTSGLTAFSRNHSLLGSACRRL